MTKGRKFSYGTIAEQLKSAEEIVEQEFGSVDAVIDAIPELRAKRDAMTAKAAAEEHNQVPSWMDEERDAATEAFSEAEENADAIAEAERRLENSDLAQRRTLAELRAATFGKDAY